MFKKLLAPLLVIFFLLSSCSDSSDSKADSSPDDPESLTVDSSLSTQSSADTSSVSNPYLDLHKRLIDQHETPLFSVTSARESYWRVIGLTTYKNTVSYGAERETTVEQEASLWEVKISDEAVPGEETRFIQPKQIPGTEVTQDFTIDSLDLDKNGFSAPEVWMPVALNLTEVVASDTELTVDPITQSVVADEPSTSGLTYSINSVDPNYSPEELLAAANGLSKEEVGSDIFLTLPTGIPSEVEETAKQITEDKTNRYEQALALEKYFQEFDYTLDLSPVPEDQALLTHFLETKQGFSQDIAGTYAVMARQLGIPSRVAVGYTSGDLVGTADDGRNIYQVKGKHAHAWPELWFGEELGWVPFEPTSLPS